MRAPALLALGLLTGWGAGPGALPAEARAAAGGRSAVSLGRPPGAGDPRFRRSTRECLWALAAVDAMLEDGSLGRGALAGGRTALIFVTAAAYAPSNRAFIEGRGGSTHFAYTAPAVMPAEVAIALDVAGPSLVLIGGPPATLRGIWHAATLLEGGACDRALVLAVEAFEGVEDVVAVSRRRSVEPMVESAACLLLGPGTGRLALGSGRGARPDPGGVRRRAGEMLACEPLVALALWREAGGPGALRLDAGWRGEVARLDWSEALRESGVHAGRPARAAWTAGEG